MISLLGIGTTSKAWIIFFSTVIPCITNSYSGIKQTNQIHLWVSQTFGGTRWQQLFTVAIPSALPMIFAGLRVAMGASWMGLVAAGRHRQSLLQRAGYHLHGRADQALGENRNHRHLHHP